MLNGSIKKKKEELKVEFEEKSAEEKVPWLHRCEGRDRQGPSRLRSRDWNWRVENRRWTCRRRWLRRPWRSLPLLKTRR